MLARKIWLPNQIGVRLDAQRLAWLQQRAEEARMTVSAYVRQLIEREARRDLRKDDSDGAA